MKRPDGVTLISVYHFFEAALFVLGVCGCVLAIFIVAVAAGREKGGDVAVPIVAIVLGAVSLVLLVIAAANAAVGWGMWRLQPWARMGAVVLSVIRLINIPLGTIIGALTLWYLFQPEAREAFGEVVEAIE